jgi:hypothetical protein
LVFDYYFSLPEADLKAKVSQKKEVQIPKQTIQQGPDNEKMSQMGVISTGKVKLF